jgi:hypothetical protein
MEVVTMTGEKPKVVVLPPEAAPRFKRVRYAYVFLALFSFLCAAGAVQISIAAIRSNNQSFCDLVGSMTSPAPPKPVNPAADPKAERVWEIYNKVVTLDHRLGCNK